MKKMLIVFIVLITGCAPLNFRKALEPGEGEVSYIEVHNKAKDKAFVAAHTWIAQNYRSANDVIQMVDKNAGMLVVKAVYPFYYPPAMAAFLNPENLNNYRGVVNYTLTVRVKKNKMKTEFNTGDISSSGYYSRMYLPKSKMPELLANYEDIHIGLRDAVLRGAEDF